MPVFSHVGPRRGPEVSTPVDNAVHKLCSERRMSRWSCARHLRAAMCCVPVLDGAASARTSPARASCWRCRRNTCAGTPVRAPVIPIRAGSGPRSTASSGTSTTPVRRSLPHGRGTAVPGQPGRTGSAPGCGGAHLEAAGEHVRVLAPGPRPAARVLAPLPGLETEPGPAVDRILLAYLLAMGTGGVP